MTKEQYVQLRNLNQINFEDVWDFYQKAEHPQEKIGFEQFQQLFPHYLQMHKDMSSYIRTRDNEFEILYLEHEGIKKII